MVKMRVDYLETCFEVKHMKAQGEGIKILRNKVKSVFNRLK